MSAHIVDVTAAQAKALLIDESFQRPVLVDVWAEWCAPCKSLKPVLEKLAREYDGAFLLACIDADAEPGLTAQLGVRSLPTVMLLKNGQPVDMFSGALPEGEVRRFLEPHLPKPWDALLAQGVELLQAGDAGAALVPLRQAVEDSRRRADIVLTLAHAYLMLNRLDDLEATLALVKMADQDADYHALKAQLELKRQAAKAPEIAALEAAHAAEPENLDIASQLALQYSQHQHTAEALALLMGILQKDRNHAGGSTHKTMLDMLAALGKSDPLAVEYRRKLYTLLY